MEEVWAEGWIEVCDLLDTDVVEGLLTGGRGWIVISRDVVTALDGDQFPCGSLRVQRDGVWRALMPSGMEKYMETKDITCLRKQV